MLTAILAALLGVAPPASAAPSWELTGVYDLSATRAIQPGWEPSMVWAPAPGMESSCGRAKGPAGMGTFEAEAVTNGLTPALAILLRSNDRVMLSRADVRVTVGDDASSGVLMEPAVAPRRLRIGLATAEEGAREQEEVLQLVRTQIEISLCLEHKVGRGWIGGEAEQVRQALLLTAPTPKGSGSDRAFFLGQSKPVPALIGPPDACIKGSSIASSGSSVDSLDMVPTDIWASRVRACTDDPLPTPTQGWLPLRASAPVEWVPEAPGWIDVTLKVEGEQILLTYGNDQIRTLPLSRNPEGGRAIEDIIGQLPYYYPMFLSEGQFYTMLIVPGWQVAEAFRHVAWQELNPAREGAAVERPAFGSPAAPTDAVGWLLAHPEYLHVQVIPPGTAAGADLQIDDLASSLGGSFGPRSWGYAVGYNVARAPLAVPGKAEVVSDQVSSAQRWFPHGLFLAGTGAMLLFVAVGLRRLPDLWSRVPEERADYWPGVPPPEQEGEADGVDMNVAEGK